MPATGPENVRSVKIGQDSQRVFFQDLASEGAVFLFGPEIANTRRHFGLPNIPGPGNPHDKYNAAATTTERIFSHLADNDPETLEVFREWVASKVGKSKDDYIIDSVLMGVALVFDAFLSRYSAEFYEKLRGISARGKQDSLMQERGDNILQRAVNKRKIPPYQVHLKATVDDFARNMTYSYLIQDGADAFYMLIEDHWEEMKLGVTSPSENPPYLFTL